MQRSIPSWIIEVKNLCPFFLNLKLIMLSKGIDIGERNDSEWDQ